MTAHFINLQTCWCHCCWMLVSKCTKHLSERDLCFHHNQAGCTRYFLALWKAYASSCRSQQEKVGVCLFYCATECRTVCMVYCLADNPYKTLCHTIKPLLSDWPPTFGWPESPSCPPHHPLQSLKKEKQAKKVQTCTGTEFFQLQYYWSSRYICCLQNQSSDLQYSGDQCGGIEMVQKRIW